MKSVATNLETVATDGIADRGGRDGPSAAERDMNLIKNRMMNGMKLKVARAMKYNINRGRRGWVPRVVTNGRAGYEEIVEKACHNTTMNKAEAKLALDLCMETVAGLLREGFIVDLGPVGRLYPSCSGRWAEEPEGLILEEVRPSLYFHPSAALTEAVREARLEWTEGE